MISGSINFVSAIYFVEFNPPFFGGEGYIWLWWCWWYFVAQVHAVQCDVRDPASVSSAVSQLINVAGLPDVSALTKDRFLTLEITCTIFKRKMACNVRKSTSLQLCIGTGMVNLVSPQLFSAKIWRCIPTQPYCFCQNWQVSFLPAVPHAPWNPAPESWETPLEQGVESVGKRKEKLIPVAMDAKLYG